MLRKAIFCGIALVAAHLLCGCTKTIDVVVINFSKRDVKVALQGGTASQVVKQDSFLLLQDVHYGSKVLYEVRYVESRLNGGRERVTPVASEKYEDRLVVISITQ